MNTVVAGSAAPQPEAWRGLPHYRFGLRALSPLLIAPGLAPLAGVTPLEPCHTLGLLGCQLFGLSLTFGNALEAGGVRGFLRAQAFGLLLFAAMRTLYWLLGPHAPSVAACAEIVLPGGIAASFFILRSRL